MSNERLPNIHPGDILREDFLEPLGMTVNDLETALGYFPNSYVFAVVYSNERVTAPLALRLSRYFGTSPDIWLNLQNKYDLEKAKEWIEPELEKIVPLKREDAR